MRSQKEAQNVSGGTTKPGKKKKRTCRKSEEGESVKGQEGK